MSKKEDDLKNWQTGYKGFNLVFNKAGEPRLAGASKKSIWEPIDVVALDPFGNPVTIKEVRSDWKGTSNNTFENSSKGLYSLKSPKAVKSEGYLKEKGILGAIVPYGKTYVGSSGHRAEKAQVTIIFKNTNLRCNICGRKATHMITEGKDEDIFYSCDRCMKKIEKTLENTKFNAYNLDEVMQKLAYAYNAKVIEDEHIYD